MTSDIIKTNYCVPTESLQELLNDIFPNYFNDTCFYELTDIVVRLDRKFNLLISTWIDDEEINDQIKIEFENNSEGIFKLVKIFSEWGESND